VETFCFSATRWRKPSESRRILELDLRKALAHEEFELFYQPLVNLKSGRISTCEACCAGTIRCGARFPRSTFIPVAEDMA